MVWATLYRNVLCIVTQALQMISWNWSAAVNELLEAAQTLELTENNQTLVSVECKFIASKQLMIHESEI